MLKVMLLAALMTASAPRAEEASPVPAADPAPAATQGDMLYARLLGEEPATPTASAPPPAAPEPPAMPSWAWLLGLGGLGLAAWLANQRRRRAAPSKGIQVLHQAHIGRGGRLAVVEVEDQGGGTRRLLVGLGEGAPALVADLAAPPPRAEQAPEAAPRTRPMVKSRPLETADEERAALARLRGERAGERREDGEDGRPTQARGQGWGTAPCLPELDLAVGPGEGPEVVVEVRRDRRGKVLPVPSVVSSASKVGDTVARAEAELRRHARDVAERRAESSSGEDEQPEIGRVVRPLRVYGAGDQACRSQAGGIPEVVQEILRERARKATPAKEPERPDKKGFARLLDLEIGG